MVESCLLTKEEDEMVWLYHQRLVPLNLKTWESMVDKVTGILPLEEDMEACWSCIAGKQRMNSFPSSVNFRATKPLKLVYGDIFGPITPSTLEGSSYFLLLIDDY